MYRVAFTESKSGRWQSAYRETFEAACELAKSKYQGLVYSDAGTLVGNFTARATNGCADYVVGLRSQTWRSR